MPGRVAEVVYSLKDAFSAKVGKIQAAYRKIRGASSSTADRVARDSRQMDKGLGGLLAPVNALVGAWRGLLAAVSGGAIVGAFRGVVNEADRVGKAARKLNITSEALSRLTLAASRENIGFGNLEIGLQRLARRIGTAIKGSTDLQKVFAQLGLDAGELSKLSLDEAFLRVADATRAITDENEQLALFFKLFDAEGVNLIRLARQGSAAIRELGDEAERLGKIYGSDFTKKAEKFSDQIGALGDRAEGAKINLFTDALGELVEFLDNVGLGDRRTGLVGELEYLQSIVDKPLLPGLGTRGEILNRISRIKYELAELGRQQRENAAHDKKEQAEIAARQAAQKAFAGTLEEVTGSYQVQLKARQEALKQETDDLRKARAEQAAIEAEFKGLSDDITAPDVGDVGLINIYQALGAARREAFAGNNDAAVNEARKGGELLRRLKEQGTESQLVLKFLAGQLSEIAKQASETKVKAEVIDEQQARQAVERVKEQLTGLNDDAVKQGGEFGRNYVAAIQAQFDAAQLRAPSIQAPVISREIVREGNAYGYRRAVDQSGGKL